MIIRKRGLGRGMGFEVVSEESIFDGNYPELLDLIRDRIAVLYNMLYEDVEDEEAEGEHPVDPKDDDEEQAQPMTPLDREIQIAEEEENEDEEEDISDSDEELIE